MNNTFNTPFGPLRYSLTDACHVYIATDEDYILINGVSYHATIHLYRQADGKWDVRNYNECYLAREHAQMRNVSDAARNKFRNTVTETWSNFVTDEIRVEAEAERLDKAENSILSDIKDAEQVLAGARKELSNARALAKDLSVENLPTNSYDSALAIAKGSYS